MTIFAKITTLASGKQVCAMLQSNNTFFIDEELNESEWNEYCDYLKVLATQAAGK